MNAEKYQELGENLPPVNENIKVSFNPTAPKLPNYLENILKQLAVKFQELRQIQVSNSLNESKIINKGNLIHGLRDFDNLIKIMENGVISGEIAFGSKVETVAEDCETNYHADFFVNTTKSKTISEYLAWTCENENPNSNLKMARIENRYMPKIRGKEFGLVFDPKHNELEEYLQFSTNGKMASKFRSTFHDLATQFPHKTDRHLAVPVGIPSNFCKSIIVGGKVEKEQIIKIGEKINQQNLSIFIFDIAGNCLFEPNYKSE